MASFQGVAFCESCVFFYYAERREYISILHLRTWVFLPKCLALHLFPLNIIFFIQKHFSESKGTIICAFWFFLLLPKVLVTSLWIAVMITLCRDAILSLTSEITCTVKYAIMNVKSWINIDQNMKLYIDSIANLCRILQSVQLKISSEPLKIVVLKKFF